MLDDIKSICRLKPFSVALCRSLVPRRSPLIFPLESTAAATPRHRVIVPPSSRKARARTQMYMKKKRKKKKKAKKTGP